MTTNSAYRSSHPSVLDEWNAWQEQIAAWRTRVREFMADYPGDYRCVDRGQRIIGLALPAPGLDMGLWRHQHSAGFGPILVPRKLRKHEERHGESVVLRARFDALACHRALALPGMPDTVMLGSHWYSPGAMQREGAVWVNWSITYEHVEADNTWASRQFDGDLWQRARVSEFYAAKEADHDWPTES